LLRLLCLACTSGRWRGVVGSALVGDVGASAVVRLQGNGIVTVLVPAR
jgi:hypothetical protein